LRVADIDGTIIAARVRALGDTFCTKDVSDAPEVKAGHAAFERSASYSASVGRFLAKYHARLGLRPGAVDTRGGATWHKHVTPPAAQIVRYPRGPQCAADSPFKARMRAHQSWYRAEVLRVPFGTGPGPSSTQERGSMLALADADRGANFVSPEVFDLARRRIAEGHGVDAFRCLRNMLSSQPMCFNLFGPLALDRALATSCMRALFPGEVAQVLEVRVEYAPSPRARYLDDRTAFDAFVVYERTDGAKAFLGIETKLTETFSAKNPRDPSKYVEHARRSPSIWPRSGETALWDRRWCQLWRDHLLVEAVRLDGGAGYAAGRLAVVHHPADPDCDGAIAGYRALLAPGDASIVDLPLDRIVATWAATVCRVEHREWLEKLRVRYLALDRSDPATA
jgi:hypothetical protein